MPDLTVEHIEKEIYSAVGRAISAWSWVEEELCWIFIRVVLPSPDLEMTHSHHIGTGFWAVESFRGKLNMLDSSLRQRMASHPKITKDWATLYKRAREKNGLRNDLAHGTVMNYGPPEHTFWVPSLHKDLHMNVSELMARYRTGLPFDLLPADRLSAKEIGDRTQSFNEFIKRLALFNDSLAKALRSEPLS
jgi:hypothetical protein